jgi:hypothetical protein
VPFVYHDSGVVSCRRYLICGRDSSSGEQMAHSAALVSRFSTRLTPATMWLGLSSSAIQVATDIQALQLTRADYTRPPK